MASGLETKRIFIRANFAGWPDWALGTGRGPEHREPTFVPLARLGDTLLVSAVLRSSSRGMKLMVACQSVRSVFERSDKMSAVRTKRQAGCNYRFLIYSRKRRAQVCPVSPVSGALLFPIRIHLS
jgi:hypothetical protein